MQNTHIPIHIEQAIYIYSNKGSIGSTYRGKHLASTEEDAMQLGFLTDANNKRAQRELYQGAHTAHYLDSPRNTQAQYQAVIMYILFEPPYIRNYLVPICSEIIQKYLIITNSRIRRKNLKKKNQLHIQDISL